MPVSMQRVMLNPDMQRPVRSRAHFVSYTSRTVLADIELIGRDGALVAYIAGCRLRAVSMPGQSRSETLPIISPSRQLTSVVSPLERAHCLEPEAVASSIRVARDDASTQDERARYHDECVPLLEALGLSLLKRQLVRSPGRDGAMTGEAPGSDPASAATHQSLHERVIGLLTEHGLAHRDEITGGDVFDDLEEFRDPSQIWTLCARDFPEQLGELTTLPLLAQ